MNGDFTKLTRYGIIGVCIALIMALVFTINLFGKFISNHNVHLINSLDKNTEALKTMSDRFGSLEAMVSEVSLLLKIKNSTK